MRYARDVGTQLEPLSIHCGYAERKTMRFFIAFTLAMWLILSGQTDAKIGDKPRMKTDLIVLHATGGPTCDPKTGKHVFSPAGTLDSNIELFVKDPEVGTHFIIGRKGELRTSTEEGKIANHVSGQDYNQRSIGIEMVNRGDGNDSFPEAQVKTVTELVKRLVIMYGVPKAGIKTHAELDSRHFKCESGKTFPKKVDPGPAFPMKKVLDEVFPAQ